MIAYRGLFLIDKEGIVQHQLVNNLPLGRSVDGALRMVDALTFVEENGQVCPANWKRKRSYERKSRGVADSFKTLNIFSYNKNPFILKGFCFILLYLELVNFKIY